MGSTPGWEDPLKKGMTWTEETGLKSAAKQQQHSLRKTLAQSLKAPVLVPRKQNWTLKIEIHLTTISGAKPLHGSSGQIQPQHSFS